MHLIKKFFALTLIFLIFFNSSIFQSKAAFTPPFDITSKAALLVNLDTGFVLFEKNAKEKYYPATLTQIMTEYLVLAGISDLPGTSITAPPSIFNELYGKNTYTADIRPGETLSAKDFVSGLFLQNSYEAALTLASYIGNGSISSFVSKMNDTAKNIGAVNTTFTNPTGMHDPNQTTTAYDMYLITKYALDQIPNFMELSNVINYTIPKTEKTGARVLSNNNLLINRSAGSSYFYQYAKGIKTGTTTEAGRCLVTTAQKNGYTYLLVILGAPVKDASGKTLAENMAFNEAKKLFNWAFEDFSLKTVVKADQTVADIPVKLSFSSDHMLLFPEKDFMVLLPSQADESSVQKTLNLPEYIKAPVKKGDVVGTMSFTVAGEKVGEVNLIASDDISQNQFMFLLDFITTIFSSLWFSIVLGILILLILVYIIVVIVTNKKKNKYKVIRHRKL